MGGQPSRCASVVAAKDDANQSETGAWKGSGAPEGMRGGL